MTGASSTATTPAGLFWYLQTMPTTAAHLLRSCELNEGIACVIRWVPSDPDLGDLQLQAGSNATKQPGRLVTNKDSQPIEWGGTYDPCTGGGILCRQSCMQS